MTTDRPDARPTYPRTIDSVPTPRSGVPTAGFGISALSARAADVPAADEPERRSRAVTITAALLAVVAVVAAVVVFRIMVPTTPSAAAEDSGAARAATQTREQPGSVVGYGQSHTYGNGLEVAANTPQRYEPSENATGTDQGVPVKLLVVVTNRTDTAFRPNTLQARATSGGQEAVAVWDPDQGIALTGPDMSIPVGATIHFHLAFAVADPADLQLEITPALYGYGAMVVQGP
ncbi:hypothetical protein [Cellulomonas phragmiteti]|uniref:DUF4352 domain-containing protein n=1 Tax=Cellulomonas phragmiteti TaxID=478780 RepID=A0ABQ4DPT5_9CELL|nr:hypothetical protein [Cellulomonas phragmiteti]GIG41367.1 hypothetical protein Cph01nite_31290 [Cellulomonas phragmiteti]